MRGAFVACVGADPSPGAIDRAVGAMRWHRGAPAEYPGERLYVAVVADDLGGPVVELGEGRELVVHGDPPRSLQDLQRDGRRFAAIESTAAGTVAARDPLGLAPLFYRVVDGAVWFSSEVMPLAALLPVEADLEALAAQAALVPDDVQTGLRGIFRVLPGFELRISGDGAIRQVRYWRVRELLGSYRGDRSAAVDGLQERLHEAVESALTDASAILLSGGLDSSAITAVAATLGHRPNLIHVAFPQYADAVEETYARGVADELGLELDVIAGDVGLWHPEDDLRTSVIPYLAPPAYTADTALAHVAKRGLRVALDGNDGDGVLGYTGREWGELLRTRSVGRLRELAAAYGRSNVAHRVLDDVVPPALRLHRLRGRPRPRRTFLELSEAYFGPPLPARMRAIDHERWQNPLHEWRARQLRQVLPVTTVRNEEHELRGARFGIDMRHPFADRRLVELLISLPAAVKSDPFRSKDLLRRALENVVPAGVMQRLEKPEYRTVLARRVEPDRCVEWIRDSGVRLPHVDYDRLYRDADRGESPPLALLMFLARAHVFAASYG